MRHQKLDGVPVRPAAEAVVMAVASLNDERRGFFVVERAEPDELASLGLERNNLAHDAVDARRIVRDL